MPRLGRTRPASNYKYVEKLNPLVLPQNITSTGAMTLNMAMSASVLGGNTTTSGGVTLNLAMAGTGAETFTCSGGLSMSSMAMAAQAYNPLPVSVDMKINGVWTDITNYVYQRDTISLARGRQNEASTMQPASAKLTLNNRDGRFTTRNPNGAYYPYLTQNTPMRIGVNVNNYGLTNYLRLEDSLAGSSITTSYATCPDKAGLQITGTIDLRIDCLPTDYTGNILICKNTWQFCLSNHVVSVSDAETIGTGKLEFDWNDGSTIHSLISDLPIPYFNQRIALRVVFVPSTGTATFYTAPTMAGSWTQLGNAKVFGATTLQADVGFPIQVGGLSFVDILNNPIQFLGAVYEAQVYNNVTLEVDPVFSSQTVGVTSFTDSQSSTWTLHGAAEISDRLYRFHGEMGSFPKSSDPSATDVYSQATAYGVSQRLQASNTPLNSPLYRVFTLGSGSILIQSANEYWPMEDGSLSTQLGSALGGSPMTFSGTPNLASFSSFVGSAAIPVTNSASFSASVRSYAFTDDVLRFIMAVPQGGDTNNAVIAQFTTTGKVATCQLIYGTGGTLTLSGLNNVGGNVFNSGALSFNVNGKLLMVEIALQKSGTSIIWNINTIKQGDTVATGSNATVTSTPIGYITGVQLNPAGGLTQTALGHAMVTPAYGTGDLSILATAMNAWLGETAASRFARLCTESGITPRIIGSQNGSKAMGHQPIDTLYNILQQCENTDLGQMFEPRQFLGLGYRTSGSLYSQPALSTADYSLAQVSQGFSSLADTQLIVNDVTANAPDGGTVRYFLASGNMSVNDPPSGIGRITTSISPNPQYDSDLSNIANWYLTVHSVDDDRYPGIPFQTARTETPTSVAKLDIGDYLKIINTPTWMPPGPVSQLCAGFQETILLGRVSPLSMWQIDINGIPERPYEVAVANTAHADTAGSTLTSNITSGATSVSVTTGTNPVWTTSGGDFPFDIIVDGERMTVTNITSSSSPQTFTVTRAVNGVVKSHSTGATVKLYNAPIAAL